MKLRFTRPSIMLNLNDIWIGIYWRKWFSFYGYQSADEIIIYVCIIPCIPIRFSVIRLWPEQK